MKQAEGRPDSKSRHDRIGKGGREQRAAEKQERFKGLPESSLTRGPGNLAAPIDSTGRMCEDDPGESTTLAGPMQKRKKVSDGARTMDCAHDPHARRKETVHVPPGDAPGAVSQSFGEYAAALQAR